MSGHWRQYREPSFSLTYVMFFGLFMFSLGVACSYLYLPRPPIVHRAAIGGAGGGGGALMTCCS